MGQFDARDSRAAAFGLSFSGEGLKFFIRAPLRCARATGARKDLFFSLPSASPFSAQARLGPRWANLWSRLTALHYRSDSIGRLPTCPSSCLVIRDGVSPIYKSQEREG
jgi:hypothetical protein